MLRRSRWMWKGKKGGRGRVARRVEDVVGFGGRRCRYGADEFS